MAYRGRFTSGEWKTLLLAPLRTFLIVAGADGTIDKKEIKAFSKKLFMSDKFKSPLAREVYQEFANDFDVLFQQVSHSEAIIEELAHAGRIVDTKVDAEVGKRFKLSLLALGKEVAEASGGFFGFGDKVSIEEKGAIVVIARALELR